MKTKEVEAKTKKKGKKLADIENRLGTTMNAGMEEDMKVIKRIYIYIYVNKFFNLLYVKKKKSKHLHRNFISLFRLSTMCLLVLHMWFTALVRFHVIKKIHFIQEVCI